MFTVSSMYSSPRVFSQPGRGQQQSSQFKVKNSRLEPLSVIFGHGKFSLIDSEVELRSSDLELSSISLTSSTLQSNGTIFHDLETLELYNSAMILTQFSKILTDKLAITMDSSELYYDDSLFFSSKNRNSFTITRRKKWKPAYLPFPSFPVVLPAQSFSITVIISTDVILTSLTISSNVVLLFQNNSTLTVTDSFVMNGGTLITEISSHLSFTSTDSLVVDADVVTLKTHKLKVTKSFDWKRGLIDLDSFSELVLINCNSTSFKDKGHLLSSNDLHVWGRNDDGKLGGGLSGNQPSATSVTLPFPIRQASIGRHHSAVLLTNGDVYTAGSNSFGRLGYSGGNRPVHEKIDIFNIIQVVVSRDSNLALNMSGSVFSWGLNDLGQLGLGDTTNRNIPTLIPNLSNIKQIAGRRFTAFALTRDGQVFGWGSGSDNILCRDSTSNVLSPVTIGNLENVKFVSAGLASYFIKENGSTLACGLILGGSGTTYLTPTEFAPDIEFTFIDTSWPHALGIDVNQKLWSWGGYEYGQLGTGGGRSTTPVEVEVIGKTITASTGYWHSVAVDINNNVWSWGTDSYSALGRTTSVSSPANIPGIVSDLSGKGTTGVSIHWQCNMVSNSTIPLGIVGNGKFSLIDSDLQVWSSKFELSSISLTSSILQSNGTIIHELETFELNNSIMTLSHYSKILTDNISITLNSSEFYYDDSVYFSSTIVSLTAIKSRYQNDFNVTYFHLLNLAYSTFESLVDSELLVSYFQCYHCQILANSVLRITSFSNINTGNFSSSVLFQASVINSSISGKILLSRSFDLLSHVILDDVSFSNLNSYSNGSIVCHSDVLLTSHVTFSSISFSTHAHVILSRCKRDFRSNFAIIRFSNIKRFWTSSTIYIAGTLDVEFDPFQQWSGGQFLLVSSSSIMGQFSSFTSTCSSLISLSYSSNSILASVNEYRAHLNHISYMSTTGVDDFCCGTFDSPCASFKGILERMGRKGKIYFLEGIYYFNQELVNVTGVNWEVVGLGDVIISGVNETVFEIDSSLLTLNMLKIDSSKVS
ncbi:hypothetical protein GEMRC1_000241 [Eukaryota sp. GEM-RC1]